jgi:GAF domain-containing protein
VVQVACVSFDVTAARLPALTAHAPGARSAAWTSRLLAVTQALNATQGPAAALGDAFGQVAAALGASSAMVAVLDGDHLTFRPDLFSTCPVDGIWSTGFALDDPTSFSVLAVTRNEPVWIEDDEAMQERFPLAHPARRGVTDERAWAAVTIRVGSEPIGVLRLAWPVPQTFPPEQRAFLQATADHAGHVLHRVRLLEQEQALRAANEAAGERNAQLLALARGLAAARSSVQVGEGPGRHRLRRDRRRRRGPRRARRGRPAAADPQRHGRTQLGRGAVGLAAAVRAGRPHRSGADFDPR